MEPPEFEEAPDIDVPEPDVAPDFESAESAPTSDAEMPQSEPPVGSESPGAEPAYGVEPPEAELPAPIALSNSDPTAEIEPLSSEPASEAEPPESQPAAEMETPEPEANVDVDSPEWQAAADEAARVFAAELESMDAALSAIPRTVSFRVFWEGNRELAERIHQAPAIRPEEQTELLDRLHTFSLKLRDAQKEAKAASKVTRDELNDSINLARERTRDAQTFTEIDEIRADLKALRETIERDRILDKKSHFAVWDAWQEANTEAWAALNVHREQHARFLAEILEEARAKAAAHDAQGTRVAVRRFQAEIATHPCTVDTLRELRQQANKLWQQAREIAREKHAAYMANASRRVEQWRFQHARNVETRTMLETELRDLQMRADSASTDVGAALLRGQVEERRRALNDLEARDRAVVDQIEETERSLAPR